MAIIAIHKQLQKRYVLLHYAMNENGMALEGQGGSLGTILCSDGAGAICAFRAEELQIVEIEGRQPGHWLERHSRSEQADSGLANREGQVGALAYAGAGLGTGAERGGQLGGQGQDGGQTLGEADLEPCPACGAFNPAIAMECHSCGLALIVEGDPAVYETDR